MSIDVDAIIHVIAYGVPALLIIFGGILLLLGYPTGNSDMIKAGWALNISGIFIYIIELVLAFYSRK
jgi:hypothetical protein